MLRNEANLSWEMSRWMPAWASQKLAREGAHGRATVGFGHRDLQTHYRPHNRTVAVGGGRSGGGGGGGGRAGLVEADAHFSCHHPLCTLMDRKNFP